MPDLQVCHHRASTEPKPEPRERTSRNCSSGARPPEPWQHHRRCRSLRPHPRSPTPGQRHHSNRRSARKALAHARGPPTAGRASAARGASARIAQGLTTLFLPHRARACAAAAAVGPKGRPRNPPDPLSGHTKHAHAPPRSIVVAPYAISRRALSNGVVGGIIKVQIHIMIRFGTMERRARLLRAGRRDCLLCPFRRTLGSFESSYK